MKKLLAVMLSVFVIGLNVFYLNQNSVATGKVIQVFKENGNLPVVGSFENLRKLLKESEKSQRQLIAFEGIAESVSADMAVKSEVGAAPKLINGDYSGTNLQVQGVDEADVIKNDGQYIYQVAQNKVNIIKANPADDLKLIKTWSFNWEEFAPSELYIDDKYLVIIGTTFKKLKESNRSQSKKLVAPETMSPDIFPLQDSVKVIIYDIRDKENIKQLREVEMEGHYVTSRKIGRSLYFVANKYIDYYRILEEGQEPPTPLFKDSAIQKEYLQVDYSKIHYFPGSVEPNYLMVAALDLDSNSQLKISTYLGSGQNVYASEDNLYVAVMEYEKAKQEVSAGKVTSDSQSSSTSEDTYTKKMMGILEPEQIKINTVLYKFALKKGQIEYQEKGKVPGTILNQFAMDEHEGYFRIATTTAKNNIYVLDQDLKIVGKIEDIAPGERIYSTRFMGNRGYMVTFKTVDPLFVIDLKNPQAPKILGELKIPGYSDYMHPYDENHIIGFGKEAIEVEVKDWDGQERKMAFYLGLKLAIFDVSDVSRPVEKFKEVIGDRGTESEVLHNHRALLFSKERNLLSLPISVAKVKGALKDPMGYPQYGEPVFEGAYVYNLNLKDGFKLKGKLAHTDSQRIERIIYIGDSLYTISQNMVKAYNFMNLREKGSLQLPTN